MAIKYEFIQVNGDEDLLECRSCGTAVPLHPFPQFKMTKPLYLCELCASTFAGNAIRHPNQYPNSDVLKGICTVGNMILKQLGKFYGVGIVVIDRDGVDDE